MKKIPELLAPAGGLDSIKAAVAGGADAVYFGGKGFNARRNAQNMTDDEMREAVLYCKRAEVKIYVTLNILIKDSEIPELLEYLNFLALLEVDGLIVQDLGLIYLLKQYYKNFKLQTSTQGSVYGLQGVLFFENQGFERVVLPREMSLIEAAVIKKESAVELKIFCHGALCYAYSGQCLLSSMIGGRSGNRGLCAQPCRKKYKLLGAGRKMIKEGYLLSLKDLNINTRLSEVANAGIDSLKIEGRMKSPEYVYAVTKAYRDNLDALSGKKVEDPITDVELSQVFNRAFTEGHLFASEDIINDTIPRNRGVYIGDVVGSEREKIIIQLAKGARLSAGDGMSFGEDAASGLKADVLYSQRNKRIYDAEAGTCIKVPSRFEAPPKGTKVYRNYDKVLMTRLKTESVVVEPEVTTPIDFKISIKKGLPVTVSVAGVSYTSAITPLVAERKPLDAGMITDQFSKLGNTGYTLKTIQVDLDDGLFLAKSQLNTLRKEAVMAYDVQKNASIEVVKPKIFAAPVVNLDQEKATRDIIEKPEVSLEIVRMDYFKDYCELPVDEIVLPVENLDDIESYGTLIEHAKAAGKKVLISFARIMDTKDSQKLKNQIRTIESFAHDGILLKNFEVLNLFKDTAIYKEADQSFNLFNIPASHQLSLWGVQGGVLSPELNGKEITTLSNGSYIKCVLPVYGHQEVMVSANCVLNCKTKTCKTCNKKGFYALIDERMATFPLRLDEQGVTHIYNGDKLLLKNEILHQKHIDKWRLYSVSEKLETLSDAVSYYKDGIFKGSEGLVGGEGIRFTKGNYKRGVE